MKKIEESSIKFLTESRIIDSRWVGTSFLCFKGKFLHFEAHFDRLQKGIKYNFAKDLNFSKDEVISGIMQEIDLSQNDFISIKILTNGEDLLFCERNDIDYFKKEFKVKTHLEINQKRLMTNFIKPSSYEKEMMLLKNFHCDEIIFHDQSGLILESIFSNVCVVKNRTLYFPNVHDQILLGVMQQSLMTYLKSKTNYNWGFKNLTKDDILIADEVWLLNSLRGIRKVIQIDDVKFSHQFEIFDQLIREFGYFGELLS